MLRFTAPAVAALCLVASPAHAQTQSPAFGPIVVSGQASVSTDGMVRGISETNSHPQGILSLQVSDGPLYAGGLIKDIATLDGSDHQNDVFIGVKGPLAGFNWNAAAWFRDNAGATPGVQQHFIEYQGDVSRTFGMTTAKIMVLYSPDFYAKTKESTWTEATLAQKLTPQWSVSGGYGHRSTTPDKDYDGWNLGTTYNVLPRTALDVRFFTTNARRYGTDYRPRLRFMLTQGF